MEARRDCLLGRFAPGQGRHAVVLNTYGSPHPGGCQAKLIIRRDELLANVVLVVVIVLVARVFHEFC